MSRLTSNGVLCDYSVGAQERMAFDHALNATPAPRAPAVDRALAAMRAQRAAADEAHESSPLGKLIPHLYRLP